MCQLFYYSGMCRTGSVHNYLVSLLWYDNYYFTERACSSSIKPHDMVQCHVWEAGTEYMWALV